MDCLPIDDICQLQQDYAAYVAIVSDADRTNDHSFSLGIFNGREYTYTWIDGSPVILIENIDKRGGREPAADVPSILAG